MANIDLVWIFVLSTVTFLIFAFDKHLAHYSKRRVPEFLMLALSFVGGAFGALCAMLLFRHKTKHTSFLICVPVFLFIHVAIEVIGRLLG